MDAEQMDHLLTLVGADITKQKTNFREPIAAKQRTAVTLRLIQYCWFKAVAGGVCPGTGVGAETGIGFGSVVGHDTGLQSGTVNGAGTETCKKG
ncbi:hypothetical protein EOD39_5730 [Acipenser ruthenus]|uniref:Uncharacterized protein n=1 Tax=Acipenser ruthenus TaxID=7906 RepID=A0A444UD41_ACIRT|nr:hypothetical protein EOD39_5730 [Acipenser ruthenus]